METKEDNYCSFVCKVDLNFKYYAWIRLPIRFTHFNRYTFHFLCLTFLILSSSLYIPSQIKLYILFIIWNPLSPVVVKRASIWIFYCLGFLLLSIPFLPNAFNKYKIRTENMQFLIYIFLSIGSLLGIYISLS